MQASEGEGDPAHAAAGLKPLIAPRAEARPRTADALEGSTVHVVMNPFKVGLWDVPSSEPHCCRHVGVDGMTVATYSLDTDRR